MKKKKNKNLAITAKMEQCKTVVETLVQCNTDSISNGKKVHGKLFKEGKRKIETKQSWTFSS